MLNLKSISVAIGVFSLILGGSTNAQCQLSLEQAQAECRSIAGQQTGYAPNAATTSVQSEKGGRARGAATGAMAGAASHFYLHLYKINKGEGLCVLKFSYLQPL
ncbi:hypothetical protein [Desulfobulbus sp.]|uniref:hypothetical protein n=1 Tax=Desulfobulbus sp. TaxID=895 RepID=UPI0027B934B5|nr:hypothetical protein [Desulfobulbus sp.]